MTDAHAAVPNGPAADVAITPELARALLADQHPDLAHLPIRHIEDGWDNAVYRLGDELALHLPRRAASAPYIEVIQRWLPVLAPRFSLPVPTPVRKGVAALGYPYAWSVVPWFEGDEIRLAPAGPGEGERLARFLKELHQLAPADAPYNPYRGMPLAQRADAFEDRWGLLAARSAMPPAHIRHVFEEGAAAAIDLPRLWFHGDLHGRNVLTHRGRISAVIDWIDMAAGDPACDIAGIWMLLDDATSRERALEAYAPTAPTIARARGWAALMAVMMSAGDARMIRMGADVMVRLAQSP